MKRLSLVLLMLPFLSGAQHPIQVVVGAPPTEYELTNTQTFSYEVRVKKDAQYVVTVLQKGMDLVVVLKDRHNHVIARQDGPNGAWGPETIDYIATSDEALFVAVTSLNEDTLVRKGRFKISVKLKATLANLPLSTALSPQQMQADLALFRAIREQANSGFYRYRTKPQLDSIYAWAADQTKRAKNTIDFYRIIATLTDVEGSCHNYTELPFELSDQLPKTKGYFPLLMKFIDGGMVVNSVNPGFPIGTQIIRINGVSDTTLMQTLSKYRTTDGYNVTQKKSQAVQNYFGSRYIAEFGVQDSFLLDYKLPFSSLILQKRIKSLSLADRKKLTTHSAPYDRVVNDRNSPAYSYRQLTSRTGLFKIKSFAMANNDHDPNYKLFAAFLDSTFSQIKQSNTATLLIDIRGNPGGSGSNSEKFFSYFANSPFRENIGAYTIFDKVPLSQYLAANGDDEEVNEYQRQAYEKEVGSRHTVYRDNRYWEDETANPVWYPDRNAFKGRIFVLIDENVASAASHFASYLRSQTTAVFVGKETTGGYYGHNGHTPIAYVLPNSKIKTGFSVVNVAQDVVQKPSQPVGHGIMPDYDVAQSLDDFIHNEDTQLKFVLALLR